LRARRCADWDICIRVFFLVGWIAEETTKEHRWNKYRMLFIVMAIGGVAGEWIADIADFALSEHLQTIL
jgi:hypothetical protein